MSQEIDQEIYQERDKVADVAQDTDNTAPTNSDILVSSISNEKIEDPYLAISHPESDQPINFVEAVAIIRQENQISESDTIKYIGSGKFATVSAESDQKKSFKIKEIFEFERSVKKRVAWRKKMRIKNNLSYEPNPSPLATLYTKAERDTMPKFNM